MPDALARRHVRALDGVRGLAIFLVVAAHYLAMPSAQTITQRLTVKFSATGIIGVDLFFVLSGFLITGILMDAKGDAHFFRNFYARRTLRIFPLYFLALVLLLIVVPAVGLAPRSGHHAWWWFFASNIFLAKQQGWSAPPYVAQYWSLAVEEQFYLLWPAIVWMCSTRRLRQVCIACLIAAPLLRISLWALGSDGIAGYVLMPTRADVLAAGALVAITLRTSPERLHVAWRWIAPACALVLGVQFVALRGLVVSDIWTQAVGYSAAAGFFAGIVALAATEASTVRRVFSSRPLVTLGKYSYALYVFHQPVAGLLDTRVISPAMIADGLPGQITFAMLALAVTMLVAMLTWRAVEKPFLSLKRYFEPIPQARRVGSPDSRIQTPHPIAPV